LKLLKNEYSLLTNIKLEEKDLEYFTKLYKEWISFVKNKFPDFSFLEKFITNVLKDREDEYRSYKWNVGLEFSYFSNNSPSFITVYSDLDYDCAIKSVNELNLTYTSDSEKIRFLNSIINLSPLEIKINKFTISRGRFKNE
jgi:hypothetical protein